DGDGGPSGLGVGRRLAFDEWKGRLWVICPKCSRWNLAPLDDRLEPIEALARAAGAGRVAAATEHVALIRWQSYALVRVGKPRRVTVATLGLAVAVNVAAGGSLGVFVWNMPNLARMMYTGIIGRRRVSLVEPPICARCVKDSPIWPWPAAAGNGSRTPPGWSKAPAGRTSSSVTWPVANSRCAAWAWNGA